jgi:hypothetical protein
LKQLEIAQYKLTAPITDEHEDIWLEIGNGQKKYITGSIYRHPNYRVDCFQAALKNSLNKISRKQVPCIVVGDINIDLIKWNVHRPTVEHLCILSNNNFQPIMVIPSLHQPK